MATRNKTARPHPLTYHEDMSVPFQLDETDRQILRLLGENARRTVADIATNVNLSSAPVARRIERLEAAGVIEGYTVVIDHDRLGPGLEAFTELRIAGDADADKVVDIAKAIAEVQEVFTTAGDPDLLLRVRVEDIEHLRSVVNSLRRTGEVTGTKTLMVLSSWSR